MSSAGGYFDHEPGRGPDPPDFEPPDGGSGGEGGATDGDRLATFIATVHDDLSTVIALRGRLFAPFDPPTSRENAELMRALAAAWSETRTTIPELIDQVRDPANTDGLAAVGLTGPELTFKMLVWQQARAQLLAAFEDSDDTESAVAPPAVLPEDLANPHPPLPGKRPRRLKRALKWLSKTLSYADTSLKSLAKLLKVADRVEEIKEGVEKIAGDTSDALPDDEA